MENIVVINNFISEATYATVAKRIARPTSTHRNPTAPPQYEKAPSPPAYNTIGQYPSLTHDEIDAKNSIPKPKQSDSGTSLQGEKFLSASSGYVTTSGLTDPSLPSNTSYTKSSLYSSAPPVISAAGTSVRARDATKGKSNIRSVDPRQLGTEFDLGSMVEVVDNPPNCRYGVIRWMGFVKDRQTDPLVGLEMVSAFNDIIGSAHVLL